METGTKRSQATLAVGIFSLPEVKFRFITPYSFNGKVYSGEQSASVKDGKVLFDGNLFDTVLFEAGEDAKPRFELMDVIIGVNFHWERRENQTFDGTLKLIVEDGRVTAINLIGIEDYLLSVISSEMSATASKNLLKAHAVISRSWLLAQIEKGKEIKESSKEYSACTDTEADLIKWYDREDHKNFDVCADDHCQRYQGVARQTTQTIREVIDETWGEVLKYGGKICDARFSKCCGGVMEEFQYCWENIKYPYLAKRADTPTENIFPDLAVEENARKWILSEPESFCNTKDEKILSQVLNSYDQETTKFYRWQVDYDQKELSELILRRSGVDYGEILDIVPLERGTSGRLWKLKIVGTKRTKTIGKELEIRKTFSTSHLYSSAFIVEKCYNKMNAAASDENDNSASSACGGGNMSAAVPTHFTFKGAGWGHGVGLCQIGAAVMGAKGYTYEKILAHYFPESEIVREY